MNKKNTKSFLSGGVIGILTQNHENKDKKTSGFAIASLVLGIFSAIIGWFPIFGWIFIILALTFGILALININKGVNSGRGIAVAGIILGGIGLIIAIFSMNIFIKDIGTGFSCTDMNCFISKANQCEKVTYEEVTEMGKIRYSTRLSSAGDYCILTKEIVELSANEDIFLKKVLTNKKMQCSYYKDDFNSQWTTSMIEGIEYCHGDLRDAIGQLLILTV